MYKIYRSKKYLSRVLERARLQLCALRYRASVRASASSRARVLHILP